MKKTNLVIFICLSFLRIYPQYKVDSLAKVLKGSIHDTVRIQTLYLIGLEKYKAAEFDEALKYSKEGAELATKINYKKGLGQSFVTSGVVHAKLGNTQIALNFYKKALNCFEEIKYKKGIISMNFNIGLLYTNTANFDNALKYYFKVIEINKAEKDTSEIGKHYLTVGYTYYKMGEFEKAKAYTNLAFRTNTFFDRKIDIGATYNQFGLIYTASKEFEKAFESFRNAEIVLSKIESDINASDKLQDVYTNLGNLYADMKNTEKALQYYEKTLKHYYESGRIYNYTSTIYNIGSIYAESKNYLQAIEKFKEAEKNAKEIGAYDVLMECYIGLYKMYNGLNNCQKSYEYYKLSINYRDSIYSDEKKDQIARSEMKHEYDLAQIADSIQLANEREIVAVRFEKEKTTRNALYIGLVLVLVTLFFIFKNLIQSKKANKVITSQKIEVEAQKKLVDEKNSLIEEKQTEIIDSINYAKRIQNALLASTSILDQNLPDHFVLFTPKDIVSGDFYWATNTPEGFILAIGDCTGHGVPGAFMSLLNISKLNEAVNQKDIYNPDRVLNYVRSEIISVLNPEGRNADSNDGMDIVLLKLKGNQLEYAAANNSFYIIRDSELLTLKPDKMPVGKSPNEHISFTLNIVELKKGDCIYLCTDGYADQFGGPKAKKFRYKQFEELLLANHHLPINDQRKLLDKTITDWKGQLEQIDDILVFGIRV